MPEGFQSTEYPGAVGEQAIKTGLFPFDAFEFTDPASATPTLTLKDTWAFEVAGSLGVVGDFDVDGTTTLDATEIAGAVTITGDVGVTGDLDITGSLTFGSVGGETLYQWQKIDDPPQGYFTQKTASWTADRFSAATGGMEVDLSSVRPAGTIRVICYMQTGTATAYVYARAKGDTNISNTPVADGELSCCVGRFPTGAGWPVEIPIDSDGKAEIAVSDINIDVYLSPPRYVLAPIGAL
jgi:hypothetical protein